MPLAERKRLRGFPVPSWREKRGIAEKKDPEQESREALTPKRKEGGRTFALKGFIAGGGWKKSRRNYWSKEGVELVSKSRAGSPAGADGPRRAIRHQRDSDIKGICMACKWNGTLRNGQKVCVKERNHFPQGKGKSSNWAKGKDTIGEKYG